MLLLQKSCPGSRILRFLINVDKMNQDFRKQVKLVERHDFFIDICRIDPGFGKQQDVVIADEIDLAGGHYVFLLI